MQLRLTFPSSTNEELFKDQYERMGRDLTDLSVENEKIYVNCAYISDTSMDEVREAAEDFGAVITYVK